MLQLIYAYLLSVVTTLVALVTALLAYVHHRRALESYRIKESRLPEACRLEDLTLRLADIEKEYDWLQSDLLTAKQTISEKQEAENWLQINGPRYAELQGQLPIVNAKLEVLQTDVAQLIEHRNNVQRELADAEHRRTILQEERKNLEELSKQLRDELKTLEDGVRDKKAEKSGIQTFLEELTAKSVARKNDLQELQQQCDQAGKLLRETNDKINSGRALVTEIESRVKQLSGQEDQLLKQIAGMLDQAKNLSKEHEDMAARNRKIRDELEETQARHGKTQQRFDELSDDFKKVQKDLRERTEQLESVRAEHDRRKAEIGEMKTHFDALQKRIADSVKIIPPNQQAGEHEKLAELWSPVLGDIEGMELDNEHDALEAAEKYLQDLGLHFPQRIIRAFHTTLKVADVSPLVVLAGISGTGKSELPRRYAQAMGMHFLNMAVQPRWDSPQDMFGFFNYLDNRYRATELARALVQMDRFGGEPDRGWQAPNDWFNNHRRHTDVLLVLLDEMNLARVEYYFSEFLSRLETRRGIRRDVVSDRRKAEIGLEVGLNHHANGNGTTHRTGSFTSPTMQLFVDTNVLFVGTMNEDESTQTLSDKVVDRANVLRFGRPSKLDRGGRVADLEPPEVYLPYEVWNNWRRSEQYVPEWANDINGWIETLNGAMQEVRRPFAFRTALSIKSYVANYPDAARYKDAMADQIEFKILPKFRGLDFGDGKSKQALMTIKKLVGDKLEDEFLFKAIEECERQASTDSQFVWHGVDRYQDND